MRYSRQQKNTVFFSILIIRFRFACSQHTIFNLIEECVTAHRVKSIKCIFRENESI